MLGSKWIKFVRSGPRMIGIYPKMMDLIKQAQPKEFIVGFDSG